MNRMFKEPLNKREDSLYRIKRNKKIYFAVFYKSNPLIVKVLYEVAPYILLEEAVRQLDRSKNPISHVGFSENWVKENGIVIYEDKARRPRENG